MLYLHQNQISRISGLTKLTNLVNLNLSHNKIEKIEGLENCIALCNLDISHNHIKDINDCEQVIHLPALRSFDLRSNQIEASSDIVPFFAQMT